MVDNLSDGDLRIEQLTVSSSRGTLDLKESFLTASIYESIFTPGTVCDITVIDATDYLGSLSLSGDETVNMIINTASGGRGVFRFALYEMGDLKIIGAQKGKQYTLKCVSEESLYAKTNYVQKAYNDLCSNIVKDIHKSYLQSSKEIQIEPTKGSQNILIPHKSPYQAISMIRKRAVSAENISSSYVFFECRDNGKQVYKFYSIEKLFKQESIREYKQSDGINANILEQSDDNILSYKIPNQFSSIDKIDLGGPRKITTFNFTTQQFESNIIEIKDTDFTAGGSNKSNTSRAFENKYFKSRNPKQAFIPVDISSRAITHIPESTPNSQAFIALMLQNSMKIRVIGDIELTAGKMINCTIPNKTALTGNVDEDKFMTGDFLISRIHHKIATLAERPRYTCVVECLKGKFENGI
jgi:hypothetical protein